MVAILRLLAAFIANLFKSRRRLEAEILFLRQTPTSALPELEDVPPKPCGGDVPTVRFESLFALVVIGHGRRQLLWFAVTRHPTAEWLAQQIIEAFPWETAPTYLVRDKWRIRSHAYGPVFTRRVRAMGIRDRPISPRSPWQNPYAERLIGTMRRDCLDHVLIFGARHLRRVLAAYSAYYNETRAHLSLDKDAPFGRPAQRDGAIVTTTILSGLHHTYARI